VCGRIVCDYFNITKLQGLSLIATWSVWCYFFNFGQKWHHAINCVALKWPVFIPTAIFWDLKPHSVVCTRLHIVSSKETQDVIFIVVGTSNLICFHTVFRTCHTGCGLFVKVLSHGLNVTGMHLLWLYLHHT